jgi:hypothetical protein
MQPQSLLLSERTSSPERSDVRKLLGVTACRKELLASS